MPETTETHSIRGHFIPAPPLPLGDDVKALFAASPRLSSLTPDELLAHIIKTRDEAYALVPFPCLGSFRFLSPGIRSAAPGETYAKLVQHLKGEADGLSNGVPRSILDLGCGLGQDTRALVVDGVPSERIVAADLSQDFLIIGHAMYGDKPSEGSIAGVRWTTCDVFEADDVEKVATMAGQEGFGTIYVGSFIHLFSLQSQKQVVRVLSQLLSKQPGALVLGRQMGVAKGQASELKRAQEWKSTSDDKPDSVFRHDEDTFRALWPQDEWELELEVEPWHDVTGAAGTGFGVRLHYAVTRK